MLALNRKAGREQEMDRSECLLKRKSDWTWCLAGAGGEREGKVVWKEGGHEADLQVAWRPEWKERLRERKR